MTYDWWCVILLL